jgi:hypothetical protein
MCHLDKSLACSPAEIGGVLKIGQGNDAHYCHNWSTRTDFEWLVTVDNPEPRGVAIRVRTQEKSFGKEGDAYCIGGRGAQVFRLFPRPKDGRRHHRWEGHVHRRAAQGAVTTSAEAQSGDKNRRKQTPNHKS